MAGRYRRPSTPEQRAKADEARAEKLAGLHDTLTEQVTCLVSGLQWQAWLDVASRFHRYSVNNTLLILAQRPEATQVAGYTLWQQLGRQVGKGEKGIAILAPVTRKATTEDSTIDGSDRGGRAGRGDSTNATATPAAAKPGPAPAGDGTEAAGDGRRRVVGWRPTYVWDVSQTSGDPLPEPARPELLAGQAPPGLWDALAAQCEAAGMTVCRQTVGPGGPNGWTDYAAREVVVRDDVDDAQAVKTLAHELGHVLLHDPGQFIAADTRGCRGTREVEAESVAYLVAAAEGLDTSGYSFAYVAGWATSAGDDVEATVRSTATRVLGAAHQVLAGLDEDLADVADDTASTTAQLDDAEQLRDDHQLAARVVASAETTQRLREAAATGPVPASAPSPARTDRTRLLAVHEAAWAHYGATTATSWVASYLQNRFGADAGQLPSYGYAPPGWTDLVDQLTARGFSVDELVDAGVAVRARTGRVVDRFRDRLMVPIADRDRQIIAFIGRRNPARDDAAVGGRDEQFEPKYLNSATTALYRKGDHLLGLGDHCEALAAGARPVLVEGPLDAAAIDLAGRGRTVGLACLGTAVTDKQAALLAAAVPAGTAVVVATDADSAGDAAAARSYAVLARHGLEPRRAQLPAGTDPADLMARGDGPALAAAVDRAEPLARHLAIAAVEHFDLRWVEQQVAAVRAAADVVTQAPPTTWPAELAAVAYRTGLDRTQLTAAAVEHIGAPDPSPHADPDAPAERGPAVAPLGAVRGRPGAADQSGAAARTAALSGPPVGAGRITRTPRVNGTSVDPPAAMWQRQPTPDASRARHR